MKKKRKKAKQYLNKCVYCHCVIPWNGACTPCGQQEDTALGKIEPVEVI